MKSAKKKFALFPLSALAVGALLFAGTATVGGTQSAFGTTDVKNAKYFPAFTSLEAAQEAAAELNIELSAEGNVLLKNDADTLPLGLGSYVSIFGTNAYAPVGGGVASGSLRSKSVTLAEAMEKEGFHVNKTLVKHYESFGVSATSGPMSSGSTIMDQYNDFDGSTRSSFKLYSDAAIVVLGRNAGEGSDVSRATGERATENDIASHKALANYTKKSSGGDNQGSDSNSYQGINAKDPKREAGPQPEEEPYLTKHALMLSEEERELIETAKQNFKKVVVLLNTSNVMEVGELQDDPAIQGILWIGRPGEDGLFGTAKILSGEINPSGHLVDEWPRDLTADPTWYNFGDNSQTGSSHKYYKADGSLMCNRPVYQTNEDGSIATDNDGNDIIVQGAESDDWTDLGVDYEEDIYNGYRYYQTYYEDKYAIDPTSADQWYKDNVVYGFGDGLSYTSFSMNIKDVYKDASKVNKVNHALTDDELESSVGNMADVKKLYVDVLVKNTGSKAGKETVQVYVAAPYTKGGIEKAAEDLVGYGKTKLLQPGESEVVTVEFNVQDFASWDYDDKNGDEVKGDYELDAGDYTIRVMETSHRDLSIAATDSVEDALDEYEFSINGNVHQHLDDFSDNELGNLFTTDDGKYVGKYKNKYTMYNSLRTADMMKDGADPEVLMSRSDFDATFPEAPKSITTPTGEVRGLQFTDEVYNIWQDGDISRLTYRPKTAIDTSTDGIRVNTALTEDATQPWYKEKADIPATWTQAEDKTNRTITKTFADLNGKDYDDPVYEEFLNQLTWDEITSLSTESRASTPALTDFGKDKSVDEDGPNDYGNTHEWCCEVTIASTWNKDLAYREGVINGSISTLMGRTGWYGPGMDMHRSAFSGRNNEYYSQDALQGGYIAAEVVSGARSMGCNPMIKHLAFNDQETNRGGQSLYTWQSEQNIRQYELREFQMAIQEGGANSGMSAYGRICGVCNQSNWYLMTGFLNQECGWNGFMITDGFLGMRWCTTIDLMVRAGNGIVYKTEPWYDTLSGVWDPTLRNGKGDVKYLSDEVRDTEYKESWNQYYYARKTAHSVLWATANSANWQNGFGQVSYTGKTMTGTAGVSFKDSVGVEGVDALLGLDSSVTYTVSGNLPTGLSINEKTGEISGTSSQVGTFNFTVTAIFDHYVEKSANFTLVMNSPFYAAQDSDDPADLNVGKECMIQYTSDVYTTSTYDSIKYSVNEGSALPDGLTISDNGLVSGKPTAAGTYNVTFLVTAVTTTADSSSGKTTTTETKVTFDVQFIVKGENTTTPVTPTKTAEEMIADLQAEIAQLKTAVANANQGTDTSALEAKIKTLEEEIAKLKTSAENPSTSGCGGSIIAATSSVAALGLLGLGLALKKKKEDK